MFGRGHRNWSEALISALRLHEDGGFPFQLTPNNLTLEPIPAIDFTETITTARYFAETIPLTTSQRVGDLLNKKQKIYVTPTDYFTVQFRQIFKDTQITFRTSKYARRWHGGPNMGFWSQQLNFALWCATTGCGISRKLLLDDNESMRLTSQLRTFSRYHVHFTTRRILYEMGGIRRPARRPNFQ